LGNWVKAWRDATPEPATALSPIERARVSELEEENRRLRMENEFLKKAAAFFATLDSWTFRASPSGGWWLGPAESSGWRG
jgi:transposase-like protein